MSTRTGIVLAAAILLLLLFSHTVTAGGREQQVCDVGADYALGIEDYSAAIRLHTESLVR